MSVEGALQTKSRVHLPAWRESVGLQGETAVSGNRALVLVGSTAGLDCLSTLYGHCKDNQEYKCTRDWEDAYEYYDKDLDCPVCVCCFVLLYRYWGIVTVPGSIPYGSPLTGSLELGSSTPNATNFFLSGVLTTLFNRSPREGVDTLRDRVLNASGRGYYGQAKVGRAAEATHRTQVPS